MASPERFRCFACGRFTDEVTEGGPTAEEAGQVERWATGVLDVHCEGQACRAAVACWVCFWKTDPDQWISAESWDALGPLVPSGRLLGLCDDVKDRWNPARYPWPP